LTDEIGTLDDAIDYAREAAGIPASRKIEVIEYPRRGWINWDRIFESSSPIGMLFGLGKQTKLDPPLLDTDYEYKVLEHITERPGEPIYMIPPEDIPGEEQR